VVFTSFPIIFYAVFDKEFKHQELIGNPDHYEVGFKG
jgi:hypothetical protein